MIEFGTHRDDDRYRPLLCGLLTGVFGWHAIFTVVPDAVLATEIATASGLQRTATYMGVITSTSLPLASLNLISIESGGRVRRDHPDRH